MPTVRRPRRSLQPPDAVEVRSSARHGRGVFATRAVVAGELIEECPALFLDHDQWEAVDAGGLHGYCYDVPSGGAVLALGYGSLYNHSSSPNAEYRVLLRPPRVTVRAARHIDAGEEVTISYAPHERLWFDPRE